MTVVIFRWREDGKFPYRWAASAPYFSNPRFFRESIIVGLDWGREHSLYVGDRFFIQSLDKQELVTDGFPKTGLCYK